MSPPVQAARIYTHHRYLLLLLSPKADTHFTILQRVEGRVDLAGWLHSKPNRQPVLVLLSVVGVEMQQCMIRNHIFNI